VLIILNQIQFDTDSTCRRVIVGNLMISIMRIMRIMRIMSAMSMASPSQGVFLGALIILHQIQFETDSTCRRALVGSIVIGIMRITRIMSNMSAMSMVCSLTLAERALMHIHGESASRQPQEYSCK
jgi:hypothetical protein